MCYRKKNSVAVLLFLLSEGGSSKATFVWNAIKGNYRTVGIIANRLKDAGLITITEIDGKSAYILYSLTNLGFAVAADLKRANDRILGLTPEEPTNCGSPEKTGSMIDES